MDPSMDQAWAQSDPMDMSQVNGDLDLSSFLDLDGGINFDMPDIDTSGFVDMQQLEGAPSNVPFEHHMSESLPASGTLAQDFGSNDQFSIGQHGGQQSFVPHGSYSAPNTDPYALSGMQHPMMQQFPHQQSQQVPYQPHSGYIHGQQVPPTPNSYEMHGELGRFMAKQQMDAQQRGIMGNQYHVRPDDAVAYTPLVSPAGTPHFHMQADFTTPTSFSPLNSPMLLGQNYGQHQQLHNVCRTNPSTAPSSTAPSPAHQDVDMLGESLILPDAAAGPAKRTRRKTATSKSSGASTRVKPSPIQKPRKRKSVSLATLGPAAEGNPTKAGLRSAKDTPTSASLQPSSASGLSSSDYSSISPEPLHETVMGPPPRPGSLTQSPAILAQQQGTPINSALAATPKSILSTRSQQPPDSTSSVAQAFNDTSLDDFALPEAAKTSRRPSLGRITTAVPTTDSGDQTPRTVARKTPKLGPGDTPSSATRPSSANTSPVFSPMTASTPSVLLKDKNAKGARGASKKRGSESAAGSNTASPALRPKISPSIKPLLPEGTTLNSPTHALLLASKSNYQNLLEGNALPGVSYPASLSTGLSSKRTSHKVAEQGRRNRINDALREMQALLPKAHKPGAGKEGLEEGEGDEVGGTEDGKAGGKGKGDKEKEMTKEQKELADVKSSNSKAATVESANEYIRKLQLELAGVEVLRRENEEMKRRLEGKGGAGFEAGDVVGGGDGSAEGAGEGGGIGGAVGGTAEGGSE